MAVWRRVVAAILPGGQTQADVREDLRVVLCVYPRLP